MQGQVKARARRAKAFRYGGWAVVVSGVGLTSFGLVTTYGAESTLDELGRPSHQENNNKEAWHSAIAQSETGVSLQLAGLGTAAAGAALLGLSYLQ